MATGWARDGAVQDQIDATVEDAEKVARNQLPSGESLTHCEECDEVIPEARRKALPRVRFGVVYQTLLEKQQTTLNSINRRGNKESQLR